MKIYFFRHAQKAMDFSSDPALTPEGVNQAHRLAEKVLRQELPRPVALWTSPKKRACQTFQPLAETLKIPLLLEEALLEQKSHETHQDFLTRVRDLCQKATAEKMEVLYICSHYDWVLEAIHLVPSNLTEIEVSEISNWAPCQYVAFNVDSSGYYDFLEVKRIQP